MVLLPLGMLRIFVDGLVYLGALPERDAHGSLETPFIVTFSVLMSG